MPPFLAIAYAHLQKTTQILRVNTTVMIHYAYNKCFLTFRGDLIMKKMLGEKRRLEILNLLKNQGGPITGTDLAKYANVKKV